MPPWSESQPTPTGLDTGQLPLTVGSFPSAVHHSKDRWAVTDWTGRSSVLPRKDDSPTISSVVTGSDRSVDGVAPWRGGDLSTNTRLREEQPRHPRLFAHRHLLAATPNRPVGPDDPRGSHPVSVRAGWCHSPSTQMDNARLDALRAGYRDQKESGCPHPRMPVRFPARRTEALQGLRLRINSVWLRRHPGSSPYRSTG